jgi:parvulin-like peptidyl-prolyl isomerase
VIGRAIGIVCLVGAAAAGSLGLAACGSGGSDGSAERPPAGAVAQVGDARITSAQLNRAIAQQEAQAKSQGSTFPKKDTPEYDSARRQILQQLVLQKVVEFEAAKCGKPCEVSRADIRAELDKIKKDSFEGSQKKLDDYLKANKLSKADVENLLRLRLEQPKLFNQVTRDVRFTLADARKYYEENPSAFRVPAGRSASHILVKDKALADRLAAEATSANFAALARRYSEDPGSKAQGGDLGQIQRGQLVPEFEKAAFALKNGEISRPVKTQFGYHIIRAETTPARVTPFAEAKANILQTQLQQRRDAEFTKWRDQVVKEWEARTAYASDDLKPETTTQTTPTAPAGTSTSP